MGSFMNATPKEIITWLRKTTIPVKAISTKANISRNTLHSWINGGQTRSKNLQKLYDAFTDEILLFKNTKLTLNKGGGLSVRQNISNEEENNQIDASYVVKLQKNEISRLEQENAQLKESMYPVQSKSWDLLEYDFYSDVRLTFIPFKRTVYNLKEGNLGNGIKHLAKSLNIDYDVLMKNYFQIKKWHPFNEHPVNDLIEKTNLKELQKLSFEMPTLFNSLKMVVGEHYFRQFITYRYKENIVHSICYIKVHWLEHPHRCECKTTFIKAMS